MTVIQCPGDGTCLKQTDYENEYQPNDCARGCTPLPCQNYCLCGSMLPEWELSIHGGLCTYCDMTFGTTLAFVHCKGEDERCPVCLETDNVQVHDPSCGHLLCVVCYAKMQWVDDNNPRLKDDGEVCAAQNMQLAHTRHDVAVSRD